VRDMAGRIALWIRKDVGRYFFLPNSPDTLVVLVANEGDFWDVAGKSIVRRIPHQEFPNLRSIVPGSQIIVVEELRSGDDTEDVVRTDSRQRESPEQMALPSSSLLDFPRRCLGDDV
jgi:hypothetical protein